MNLRQLTYFKKLAELQHYTKASSDLFISQPSLSYAIASLEEELGTQLFQKSGRNVIITKYGKEFYEHIAKALTEIDEGVTFLRQHTNSETGRIEIGVIPTMTGDFMPKIVQHYLQLHPQTDFHIYPNYTKEVIQGIKNGIYDVGFCSKDENEPDLAFIPMYRQDFVLIAQKNHELAKMDSVSVKDLEKYQLITYRKDLPIGKAVLQLFQSHHIVPNISHTFEDETTIGGMVAHDFGIAIVAQTPLLRQFDIAAIPILSENNYRIVYLTYDKSAYQTEAVTNFIHYINREIAERV